jgi:hypothetical protein
MALVQTSPDSGWVPERLSLSLSLSQSVADRPGRAVAGRTPVNDTCLLRSSHASPLCLEHAEAGRRRSRLTISLTPMPVQSSAEC